MEKRHIYTTVNGLEVEYQAISLDALYLAWNGIEKEYRARGEPIDPPTYEITFAGGSKGKEPHDETTLQTDEDRANWALYVDATNRMVAEKENIRAEFIYEDALGAIKIPDDDKWKEKYIRRKIALPEDAEKLRRFYIDNEILVTKADKVAIWFMVNSLSQAGKVDEAALETTLESFFSYLGRAAIKRVINKQKKGSLDA